MDKKNVRMPRQKRSIEKKEKIIEAAWKVFMDKGYYSTNTPDIAKEAGISTGSIYAYFEDKKAILLTCMSRFGDTLTQEICRNIAEISFGDDISSAVKKTLLFFVNYQNWSKLIHEEIMALKYRDEDVKMYFMNRQKEMMDALTKQLENSGHTFRHAPEQMLLLFQMIMGIEDELVFSRSPDIDHDILFDECARTIISMLVKK